MIEAIQSTITILGVAAAWIAAGCIGAAIQLAADRRMAIGTEVKVGLEGFADRFYFAIFALTGPFAIAMSLGSLLSAILFGSRKPA